MSVTEYFDAIEESGVASNVATLVCHGTVRYNVMGMEDRAPSEAELGEMADLVTEALEMGRSASRRDWTTCHLRFLLLCVRPCLREVQ